jgi:hypothetical protein
MNEYYVYLHKRRDSKKVFYVGKGKDERATSTGGRNRYWNRIVKKDNGFLVEVVDNNLSNDDAYELEISVIKEIGLENLTNVSAGGDGQDNSNLPPEKYKKWIENKSKAQTGKVGYYRGKKRPNHSSKIKQLHKEGRYSYSQFSRPKSKEMKANLSKTRTGMKLEKVKCNFCDREISTNNIKSHTTAKH